MPERATIQDYILLQGGYPDVVKNGKRWDVIHNYPGGDGMIVPTRNINQGIVIFAVNGVPKEFEIALVVGMHGEPCEQRSRRYGGDAYDRLK